MDFNYYFCYELLSVRNEMKILNISRNISRLCLSHDYCIFISIIYLAKYIFLAVLIPPIAWLEQKKTDLSKRNVQAKFFLNCTVPGRHMV